MWKGEYREPENNIQKSNIIEPINQERSLKVEVEGTNKEKQNQILELIEKLNLQIEMAKILEEDTNNSECLTNVISESITKNIIYNENEGNDKIDFNVYQLK